MQWTALRSNRRPGRVASVLFCASIFSALSAPGQSDVLTANYDNLRTNSTSAETRLNHFNVVPGRFGKLYSIPVDGQVYAQPLYMQGLTLSGRAGSNVLFVATMHNQLAAFDVTAVRVLSPIWAISLGAPVSASDYGPGGGYTDIIGEVGILGTPVIDPSTSTLYAVSANYDASTQEYSHWLHAIDIRNGSKKMPSVKIEASVPGTAADASPDGRVYFQSYYHLQRPGLLLLNGNVYVGFGSHGDAEPYHGWILGYSASDISRQTAAFCSTPNGVGGSFWMGGQGLVADETGSIWAVTGNGDFDGKQNLGETLLRLDPTRGLQVADWFTPANYTYLNDVDLDLGSSAPLILPGTDIVTLIGKEARLYALRRSNLGNAADPNPGLVQSFRPAPAEVMNRALWARPGRPTEYFQGFGDVSKAFEWDGTQFPLTPTSQALEDAGYAFHGMALSHRANDPDTAIFWVTATEGADTFPWPGVLRAYDATDLSKLLWSSDQDPRDALSSFAKFATPTIGGGRLYLPTSSGVIDVYGLLSDLASTGPVTAANAFSLREGVVSPGALIRLRGDGIGPPSTLWAQPDLDTGALPTSLGDIQVLMNGQPAALFIASPDELLAIVPPALAGLTAATVEIQQSGRSWATFDVQVADADPGLETTAGTGAGTGNFVLDDGTPVSSTTPARPGSVVHILATGVGPTGGSMSMTDPLAPPPQLDLQATVDGIPAQATAANAMGQPSAVIDVVITVPDAAQPGTLLPVSIQAAGYTSQIVLLPVGFPVSVPFRRLPPALRTPPLTRRSR